ncbi:MAG: hypothetical protein WDN46_18390 [Methylocella sp.]
MGVIVPLHAVEVLRSRNYRPTVVKAAEFKTGRLRSRAVDAPLDCLMGRALAAHFHAWRGASGKRYVCSVFPVTSNDWLGGLPQFDAAVALAVGVDGEGQRTRVNTVELSWSEGQFTGDLTCVRAALRAGACEWHIHLLAENPRARQAMIDDLEGDD